MEALEVREDVPAEAAIRPSPPGAPAWQTTHDPVDAARYRQHGWWGTRSHLDDLLAAIARHPEKDAIIATGGPDGAQRRVS